jgi:hypothetical protein
VEALGNETLNGATVDGYLAVLVAVAKHSGNTDTDGVVGSARLVLGIGYYLGVNDVNVLEYDLGLKGTAKYDSNTVGVTCGAGAVLEGKVAEGDSAAVHQVNEAYAGGAHFVSNDVKVGNGVTVALEYGIVEAVTVHALPLLAAHIDISVDGNGVAVVVLVINDGLVKLAKVIGSSYVEHAFLILGGEGVFRLGVCRSSICGRGVCGSGCGGSSLCGCSSRGGSLRGSGSRAFAAVAGYCAKASGKEHKRREG